MALPVPSLDCHLPFTTSLPLLLASTRAYKTPEKVNTCWAESKSAPGWDRASRRLGQVPAQMLGSGPHNGVA